MYPYQYSYSTSIVNPEAWGIFWAIILGVAVVSGIVGLVLYILNSVGLMKIADKTGIEHGWFAWIPVLCTYLTGKVAFKTKAKAACFLIITLVVAAIGGISAYYRIYNGGVGIKIDGAILLIISNIALLLGFIINLIADYKIYKLMSTKAAVMLVFTILTCGLLAPIFIFAIRNNEVIKEK